MTRDYEINDKDMRHVLAGDLTYARPGYQRDYSWRVFEAERLWNDIIHNEGQYLLGSIVVMSGDRNADQRYDVVDGQQRLATLTLMFCAIRDYVIQHTDPVIKNKNHLISARTPLIEIIQKLILYNDVVRLRLSNPDNRIIEQYQSMESKKDKKTIEERARNGGKIHKSQTLMIKNYELFREKIKELCEKKKINFENDHEDFRKKLTGILDNILDRTVFAFVQVKKEEDAFQVFEVLNATGRPLTQADMIKNHIIKRSKNQNHKDDWKQIIDQFEDKPDAFIYESLLSRDPYNKGIRMRNLYNYIKEKYTDTAEITNYLNKLREDSQCAICLQDPDQGRKRRYYDRRTMLIFEGIGELEAKYIRTAILAASRRYGMGSDEFQKIAECLLIFFFMHITLGDGSTDLVRNVSRDVSDMLNKKKNFNEIISRILIDRGRGRAHVKKSDFDKAFVDYASYNSKAAARYILMNFEEKLSKSSDIDIEYDDFELEHILPIKARDADWKPGDFDNDRDKFKNMLGNLTLIKKPWNKSLQNRGFVDKKEGRTSIKRKSKNVIPSYKNSELKINQEYLANYTEWTSKTIKERGDILCKQATEIWDLTEYFQMIGKEDLWEK